MGPIEVFDGVALALAGDTLINIWRSPARVDRSRWLYDALDRAAASVPHPLQVFFGVLPSAGLPDAQTRAENRARLKKLRPRVRRLVAVPLGEGMRFLLVRGTIRAMALAGGWSDVLTVEDSLGRGVDATLRSAGPATPSRATLEEVLHEQLIALGVDPHRWLDRPARPKGEQASSPPLAAGSEISHNLRLRHRLSEGGMGVLWVAEHLALRTDVVVKFLRAATDAALSQKRVAWEAQATALARSPHVVQVLDHGTTPDGAAFLVTEHLEGRTLRALLETHGTLVPEETCLVVHQLAQALTKVHQAGLVHADVKPSNVFVCEGQDLFVKLLDFGLARRAGGACPLGGRVGSLRYMSPEQLRDGVVDGRSDVWALGVLVFRCLTGVHPFEGETTGGLRMAIENLPLPRPTQYKRELLPEVDAWFARACSRSRVGRFRSAIEASDSLARALRVDFGVGDFPHASGIVAHDVDPPDSCFTLTA